MKDYIALVTVELHKFAGRRGGRGCHEFRLAMGLRPQLYLENIRR